VRGGHITDATVVYSDRPLPSSIRAMLVAAGVRSVVPAEAATVSQVSLTPGECP
jgi:hypothetical protein